MANDLTTMMTEVRQWFDVNSVRLADAPLKRIINDVIKDLYRRGDFSVLQDTDTSISTVAGTVTYTLPTTIGRIIGVYVTKSGASTWLKYTDPTSFQETYGDVTTRETPVYFTIWSGSIKFGPPPDGVYTVSIMNFKYPEELSNTTDTHEFMTYAWDAVLYGTLAEVAKYLMESERIPEFLSEYEKRVRRFAIDQTRAGLAGWRPISVEPAEEI